MESQLSLEKKLISYLNLIKSYNILKFGHGTVTRFRLDFSFTKYFFKSKNRVSGSENVKSMLGKRSLGCLGSLIKKI